MIPERGECQHFERGHLKGKMKQNEAIFRYMVTEPYYDFCGCISFHMNSFKTRWQKACVCVCVREGGGSNQCTFKMSLVESHKFVLKVEST